MIRPLLIVAVCAFVASAVCFAIAGAFGGFEFRKWRDDGFFAGDHDFRGPPVVGDGPTVTRRLAWDGGDEIAVSAPVEVDYTQGPAAEVVVTGPQAAVDQLVVSEGRVRFRRPVIRLAGPVRVAITAPGVREFTLHGAQALKIEGYDQDRLEVTVAGAGSVEAKGRARRVELRIAGSGDANLGALASEDAEVSIAGSGRATIAPTQSVEANIAGSGDVVLTTNPPDVESNVFGSGRIVRGGAAEPAPPAPPAPPKLPTRLREGETAV